MFRVIFAIHRRSELSREQFADRWVQHGPLLQGLPNLRSYTQCLVTGSERLTGPEADGISIMDFDSEQDYRLADSSAAMQAAHDDAAGFVGSVSTYYAQPRQVC